MFDRKSRDAALQAELLLSPSAIPTKPIDIPPAPIQSIPRVEKPVALPKPKRQTANTPYDLFGQSVATIFGLGVNALFWWAGAAFTLLWLGIDPKPTQWAHVAWYLIPFGITLTETHFWPKRGRTKTEVFIWLVVLSIDIWATYAGFREWGAGRSLGGGMTLPKDGFGLSLIAVVLGMILAIGPEKMARSLVARLGLLLKTAYYRMTAMA